MSKRRPGSQTRMGRAELFFVVMMLVFAAGLRLIGNTFGQPNPDYYPSYTPRQMIHSNTALHSDEFHFVSKPLQMLVKRQLHPHFFENPNFLINLNFVTYWLTGADNGITLADREGVGAREYAPFHLYPYVRTLSALGGVLAVAGTYAIARFMAGRHAAAAAGMLVTVSLPMVQHAHYATTSSLAAGFAAVSIWAAFATMRRADGGQTRLTRGLFALAGLAAGLAAGNRYNAAAVSIVVCVAGLILLYRHRTRQMLSTVGVGWALFPLSFLFTTPYLLRDPEKFMADFRYITGQYAAGTGISFSTAYGLYFEYRYLVLFGIGLPAAMAVLLGLYAAWRTRPTRADFLRCILRRNSAALYTTVLLLYVLPYSIVILRTPRPSSAEQMLLPVIPVFAAFAGMGVCWLSERLTLPARARIPGLIVILVIMPLVFTVQAVQLFAQVDTRAVMETWIYEHLPPGSHVHLTGPYNVALDESIFPTTQTYGGDLLPLDDIRALEADYLVVADTWFKDISLAWEVIPADYRQEVQAYLETFDHDLQRLAQLDSPAWIGRDQFMSSMRAWHDPALTVYCLHEAACDAVR